MTFMIDLGPSAELEQLYADLPHANARAAEARIVESTSHELEGHALFRSRVQDQEAAAIIYRIKELEDNLRLANMD